LDKSSDDFEISSDELVYELGKVNMWVLSYQSKVIELRSVIETKSFQKEEEIQQRPIDECNFSVDMCAAVLKIGRASRWRKWESCSWYLRFKCFNEDLRNRFWVVLHY
jgi:hypothetical protein